MSEAYKHSQCSFHAGGTGWRADLSAAMQSLRVNAEITVVRLRRGTGTGKLGMTADAVRVAYNATATLLVDDEVDKLQPFASPFDHLEAILFVDRADAGRAFAFPAAVTTREAGAAPEGGQLVVATFSGRPTQGKVEGARLTTAASRALTSGQVGYLSQASGITIQTATFTQPANSLAVVGTPITAEAIS